MSLRRLPRDFTGDSSLWRLFLFTETSRGLFSTETFPLYGDFPGTLLYGDFSSLRRLPGDSSLWRLFLFTETSRGLFSTETFPLYGDFPGTLLYGDFSSLRRLLFLFPARSFSTRLGFCCHGNTLCGKPFVMGVGSIYLLISYTDTHISI